MLIIKAVGNTKAFWAEILPWFHGAHRLYQGKAQLVTVISSRCTFRLNQREKHHILQREFSTGSFVGCICTLLELVATRSNTSACAGVEGKDNAVLSSRDNRSGRTDQPREERWTCIFLQWWWWCHDMVNKVFHLFSFSSLSSRSYAGFSARKLTFLLAEARGPISAETSLECSVLQTRGNKNLPGGGNTSLRATGFVSVPVTVIYYFRQLLNLYSTPEKWCWALNK